MLSGLGLVNVFIEVSVVKIIRRNSELLSQQSHALASIYKFPVKA